LFRISIFEFRACVENFVFFNLKNLRKNSYEIFNKLCKTNPIFQRIKLMQSIYAQRIMNENLNWGFVKTKPIKPNNHSSLITNHLGRQTQFKPKRTQFWPKNQCPIAKQSQFKTCPRLVLTCFSIVDPILAKNHLSPREHQSPEQTQSNPISKCYNKTAI